MGKVFISYSHEDVKWKKRLCKHLKTSNVEGPFTVWSDDELKLGDKYHKEIQQQIELADIAILLVSVDFLSSDYVSKYELPPLEKRFYAETIRIIPVVIGDCDIEKYWFTKALCLENKDVIPKGNRDKAFSNLAKSIRKLLEQPSSDSNHISLVGSENKSAQALSSDGQNSSNQIEQRSITCDSKDEFQKKLLDSLTASIQKVDLPDFHCVLEKYLETDLDDAEQEPLVKRCALKLIKRGFYDVVQGAIYQVCQFFLTDQKNLSVAETDRCSYTLSPAQRLRFTRTITEIMGLLALYELDETIFQDEGKLQKIDGDTSSYFIAQGVSTPLGVELLLRRIDSSDRIIPDFHPGSDEVISLKGHTKIQKASRTKWSNESNLDHALVDIWNAVKDYEDQENRYGRKNRDEKLDEEELELLNAKIELYREHRAAPRCFFIAEKLGSCERERELFCSISTELPALTVMGFKADKTAKIFVKGDMKIRAGIESIYTQFGFCEQQQVVRD